MDINWQERITKTLIPLGKKKKVSHSKASDDWNMQIENPFLHYGSKKEKEYMSIIQQVFSTWILTFE